MEFDDILKKHLGDFGRYQLLMLFALTTFQIPTALYFCEYSYIAWDPVYICAESQQTEDAGELETEVENGSFNQCFASFIQSSPHVYNVSVNDSELTSIQSAVSDQDLLTSNISVSYSKCTKWTYDNSPFHNTMISEWDLVCDKEFMVALSQAIFISGAFCQLILGSLSDKYGRRPVLCTFVTLSCALHFITAFSYNIYMFLILRFLCGCTTGLAFLACKTLGIELVSTKWRPLMGSAFMYTWSSSYLFLAAIIYVFRSWRAIMLATTGVTLPFLLYTCFLDESPRWLIANNRQREGKKVLEKIARINKKTLPSDLCVSYKVEKTCTHTDLFNSKRLILHAVIMSYNWCVTMFIYFTLVFFVPKMGGNMYISLCITSVSEILASLYAQFSLNTVLGRKWNTMGAFLLSAVVLFCLPFVPDEMSWVRICLVMLGKQGVTANITFVYIHASEIYPTRLRSSCLSIGYAVSRIGLIMSPFISQLQSKQPFAVTIAMAGISLFAGLLCILLPETRHHNMTDTLAEGNKNGAVLSPEVKTAPEESSFL